MTNQLGKAICISLCVLLGVCVCGGGGGGGGGGSSTLD